MKGLRGILLGALLLRLFLLAAVPPGEAPDERAHGEYVRALAEERRFPVQSERTGEGERYEYYQPPLFYLLAAPLHLLAGGGDRALYSARALNVALSLLALGAIASCARRWFPGREEIARAAAAFAAFHPALAANGASANNDGLLVLLSTLAFDRLFRQRRSDRLPAREGFALAALLGLGLLAKVSGAILLPAVALALLLPRPSLRALGETAAVLLGALLLASPWYLRNLSVYGRLVPLEIANVPWVDRPGAGRAALEIAAYAARSFWVALGQFNEVEVRALRPLLYALAGALLLAFGLWIRHAATRGNAFFRALGLASALALLLLAALVASFGWLYGQGQGRFLFPLIGPVSIAAAFAAARIAGPGRAPAAGLGGGLFALFAAEFLLAFVPEYYPSVAVWAR